MAADANAASVRGLIVPHACGPMARWADEHDVAEMQRARDLEPRWALPGEELKRYIVRN